MKLINEKNSIYSMENNSHFLAQSMTQSSKTESQVLESLGSAPVVVGLSLKDMASKVGMYRAIKSYLARYRYILNLWIVREIYLWRALNQRFKDIPIRTKEHRFLRFVNKHPSVKTLALKLEKRCLHRITANHYQPSLTVNKHNYPKREVINN